MFVTSPSDIAELVRACGWIAIDSEFISEGHYQPLLCLVQIATATKNGQLIELFDPLDPTFTPEPICEVLADPAIEVILHAGRQDIAIIKRSWNTEVTNIFDTQIAAGFVGERAQLSYTKLVERILKTRVHHSAGFTRWDRRPLTDKQLAYARCDVEHLKPLTDKLKDRLNELQRLTWVREECQFLSSVSDERTADTMLWKLGRINSVSSKVRAISRELICWRNDLAKKHDQPPSAILSDATLLELAKQQPQSETAMYEIRGISKQFAQTHAKKLISTIAHGTKQEPIELPSQKRQSIKPTDSPIIVFCEAFLRARANEIDIAYELLASRSDLERIISAQRHDQPVTDVRPLYGWRKHLVGDELLDLLAGKLKLSIDQKLQLNISQAGSSEN